MSDNVIEIEDIDRRIIRIRVIYRDGIAYVNEYFEDAPSRTLAKYVVADE